ncbi:MAG: hypothetical protein JKY22_12250 [Flavobacteriaceae bacterium]|nr:hypothetical protein [Flavobacteriaceae bacterium]
MIKLSSEEISILGRPNFACANVAKILIASNVYEDKEKKAEYEQAVYIHWASGLLIKHGKNWREEGDKILNEEVKKLQLLNKEKKL